MARSKQSTPVKGVVSSEVVNHQDVRTRRNPTSSSSSTPTTPNRNIQRKTTPAKKPAGLIELLVCIGGIYASFLSWAVLQERITTTVYGPPNSSGERFNFPIFLNTIQSTFAFLVGYLYLFLTTFSSHGLPSLLPEWDALPSLILVSITSSLASPFGYASLKHIDYITFILAKSCKLLPVMALHLTIFRKKYPIYKYAVVGLVTAGVAVFTIYHPSTINKRIKSASSGTTPSSPLTEGEVRDAKEGPGTEVINQRNAIWGLFLLGVNLLFDGLTNSTQDWIFGNYKNFTGNQMMCIQNLLNTVFTLLYLFGGPWIAKWKIVKWFGIDLMMGSAAAVAGGGTGGSGKWGNIGGGAGGEFQNAIGFLKRYPEVTKDVLSFAACGAVGQIFIFYTLSHFSSLLLVTVTVTRKMLTMILSVIWFGHRLSFPQWVGVGLVFGGVGAEGWIQKREKEMRARGVEKEKEKKKY